MRCNSCSAIICEALSMESACASYLFANNVSGGAGLYLYFIVFRFSGNRFSCPLVADVSTSLTMFSKESTFVREFSLLFSAETGSEAVVFSSFPILNVKVIIATTVAATPIAQPT